MLKQYRFRLKNVNILNSRTEKEARYFYLKFSHYDIFGWVLKLHIYSNFKLPHTEKVGKERKRIKSFPYKLIQSKSTTEKEAYFLLCRRATLSRMCPN